MAALICLPHLSAKRVIGLALVLCLGISCWNLRRPSDNTLIAHFNAHRRTLEELRSMLVQDVNIQRITAQDVELVRVDGTQPSLDRLTRYRELFTKAELSGGVLRMNDDPQMIVYPLSTAGLITAGWDKGFAFTVTPPPDPIVESLDPPKPARRGEVRRYRALGDGWYLYLTRF